MMDLATIIIVMGTFLGAILFLVDKYMHHNTLQTKKNLLQKFREVKGKSIMLHKDMEHLVMQYEINCEEELDNKECLDILKEKIEIEYSDAEYFKLKKINLTKERIAEYSERFRYHQDALISLRQHYNRQLSAHQNRIDAPLKVV